MHPLKVLITVKTYPIPSATYDELVCTAGVTETGDFVRLYPINFRDLPFSQQYRKYQWIEVMAHKHKGRDVRKESYRPDCATLTLGSPLPTRRGDWSQRAKYVLKKKALSMEDLCEQQKADRTSLGIFRPKKVHDLVISPDSPDWKPSFRAELAQRRLWETREITREPPRKVPFKFHYEFECDDPRCTRSHRMMIEDWEVGALYWRMVDKGATPLEAAKQVREKFLLDLCSPGKDTHFFVGTILAYPGAWVVVGVFYPKTQARIPGPHTPSLFGEQEHTEPPRRHGGTA
ncbi:MAG: hypothetical protein IMZ66_11705 [Planctomycetes bacterium]|nr:hypothetical protein [Planctomycetota bacterium]